LCPPSSARSDYSSPSIFVARLLQTTLDEEKKTDARLTELAEEDINIKAEAAAGSGNSWGEM
jgi:hypothetical protein